MSYTLTAYLVAPAGLHSFWGSQNAAPIADELSDELEELGILMEDLDVPAAVTARSILQDIADGTIRHGEEAAFAYGYMYEHLCSLFGDRVEPNEEGDGFGYALQALGDIEPRDSAFIPIPFSNDVPHIASYAPDELAAARAHLTAKTPHEDPAANALLARQLGALFDRAQAESTGLVLFDY